MNLRRLIALGCVLGLPVFGQQTAPAPAPASTQTPTPAPTPFPLPNGHPTPPHTPLRGPYHLPLPDTKTNAKEKESKSAGQTNTPAPGNGTVVFSRQDTSDGTSGTAALPTGTGAVSSQKETVTVTNVERTSLVFTAYDLEVHLVPSESSLSARARMTVRNDGPQPLQHFALQISSSLAWYSIHAGGKDAPFATHTIDSDVDHTGKLDEALVTLPQPLAVGGSLSLDVIYSGTVHQSAERLLRLGAPEGIALSSDWDRIAPGFSGLRGFGNVVWFPVSTTPALLGDGSRVFDTIGQWRLRQSPARVRLHLLVEHRGPAPNIAILNGHVILPDAQPSVHTDATMEMPGNNTTPAYSSSVSSSVGSAGPGAATQQPAPPAASDILHVVSFTLAPEGLGFRSFGLFVMTRAPIKAMGITVYARPGDEEDATSYQQAADLVRPTVEQWLGARQKRPIILVDLPEKDDLPYEDRNVLWLPLVQARPNDLTPMLAHMASHACFISPRIWLDEGVAQFMTTLWTEHVAGRDTAIEQLDSRRAALALAEPAHPGEGVGQSLVEAYSDVYYRDKSAFVFWMLRSLVGDGALGVALRNYDAAQDRGPSYFQGLLERPSHKNIEWFFDDWVYRDHGLPDLKIASVYSRPLLHNNTKNYLVSVDVENDGYCAAEVPVELQSGAANQSGKLMVPAQDKAAVRILMQVLPDEVRVNDGTVPEVESSVHRQTVAPPRANGNAPVHH
jgi:hypothetical protein